MNKEKYDLAWKYLEDRNHTEAMLICDDLLGQNENDYLASYIKGHIYYDEGNLTDALKFFLIVEGNTNDDKILGFLKYWIGNIYNTKQYKEKEEFFDKDKAIHYYNEAIKYPVFPYSAITHLAEYENDLNKKIELYDIGINKFPDNSEFYLKKAQIFNYKLKDQKQYYEILLLGLEKTNSDSIHYLLAEYFYNNSKYDIAIEHFNKIIKDDSNKRILFALNIAIANCFFMLAEYNKAIEYYELSEGYSEELEYLHSIIAQIVTQYNIDSTADFKNYIDRIIFTENIFDFYFDFIMLWLDEHHDLELSFTAKDALNILNKINSKSFNHTQSNKLLLLKSILLNSIKRYRESVNALRKLVDEYNYEWLEKQLAISYDYYLSKILEKNGSISQYINFLKSDIARHPRFKKYLIKYSLKDIVNKLHNAKNYSEVVTIYNLLDNDDLDSIDIWFEFAFSLKKQNQSEKSKYAYEKAIKSNPNSSAALNNLGVIYEENNDLEKAIYYFEKARSFESTEELYKRNLTRVTRLNEERKNRNKISGVSNHYP